MTLSSEADFLRLIDRHFPQRDETALRGTLDTGLDTVQLGRGDDCAVVSLGETACLSSDIFLEDVHFRRSYFSPEDIGHKALAVNISDVAAMGCVPRAFALDLMVPEGLDEAYWDRLFTGMASLADEHKVALVGGDLSRAPLLGLTVHIWGTPGPTNRILTRGNAIPGDLLAVVGSFGLARIGLAALEKNGLEARQAFPAATAQHLRPQPRVADGLALATIPGVRGLMDISDGLARDLPRFLAASMNVGAELRINQSDIHDEIIAFCAENKLAPIEQALLGGEDYGLLTALAPEAAPDLSGRAEVKIIGTVTEAKGVTVNGQAFETSGFDHFGGRN